jgi:hypothetical protein
MRRRSNALKNQRKLACTSRQITPVKGWRNVLSILGVFNRDRLFFRESRAPQAHAITYSFALPGNTGKGADVPAWVSVAIVVMEPLRADLVTPAMQTVKTRPRVATREVVTALLEQHGRTYSEELGIRLGTNTPSSLFCWLCAALLFSARISAGLACRAAAAVIEQGWTTAQKMAQTSWSERARVLNHAGYARYDERTATMLGSCRAAVARI